MPNPLVRLRLDGESVAILDSLAAELGLTRSGVMRLALHQLRKAQSLEVPAPSPEDIAAQRRSSARPGPRPSRAAQRDQAAGTAPPSDAEA